MTKLLERPAMGQVASVGALYDANSGTFRRCSLFNSGVPPKFTITTELNKTTWNVCYGDTYTESFRSMHVGPELGASLLSGLFTPHRVGHQLLEINDYSHSIQASVYHTLSTFSHKLNLASPDIKSCISSDVPLKSNEVTHIVARVDYGVQSVLVLRRSLKSPASEEELPQFKRDVDHFVGCLRETSDSSSIVASTTFDQFSVSCTALGDEDIVLNNTGETKTYFDLVPLRVQTQAPSKAMPVCFHLMPIDTLHHIGLIELPSDIRPVFALKDCFNDFISICDKLLKAENALRQYQRLVDKHRFWFHPDRTSNIAQHLYRVTVARQEFQKDFGHELQSIRSGLTKAQNLQRLLDSSHGVTEWLETSLICIGSSLEKVLFIRRMIENGVAYLGYDGIDWQDQLVSQNDANLYLLFFSELAIQDQESWDKNQALMLKLSLDRDSNDNFAIVDCDATRTHLETAVIKRYQHGVEQVKDLQEETQYLATHCIAKRRPGSLDTEPVQKPTKRRPMKLSCPGPNCSDTECEWQCPSCHGQLEYGYTDPYVYCDCGRSLYDTLEFKCNSDYHRGDFVRYNNTTLLNILNGLDQSNYLNILILGETGVGKSTFVNAFINYLYFETLDEALQDDDLHWLIPCAFTLQTIDRSKVDGEINETRIEVGSRVDESDGTKGRSATQTTQVYTINDVEGANYRLIDTLGIGDTRGLEFDKKNMEDILRTVSGYDHLHGILILLKPNNARLTAQFSFCIKELLTHLHRDAVNNVVFGFTNTRVSHYTPGDTLGPLKALIEEHKDIGLKCSSATTYCFDSESFRFLAAAKKNIKLENKPDFDSSWAKSKSEVTLMLERFRSRKPHPIHNTISLNATRNLILELVKPMTTITQTIRANIEIQEEEAKALQDHNLTGTELNTKLYPVRELLRKKDTYKPRTVCTDPACMKYTDDGMANQSMLVDYPAPCHPVCRLKNVQVDVRAHPDLMCCSAFQCRDFCLRCGHHWAVHMHILYELESYRERVLDPKIQKMIEENASDIAKKLTATRKRKDLIVEYQKEQDEIQQAAAKFGLWMKDNSIMAYNDATKAYIEILIKTERAKVDAGGMGNKRTLADLEKDLAKHEELVRVLDDSMKSQGQGKRLTEDEVAGTIQRLYGLRHFGEELQNLKILNSAEHEQTNREIPHRVKIRQSPRHQTSEYAPGKPGPHDTCERDSSYHMRPVLGSKTLRTDGGQPSRFSRGQYHQQQHVMAPPASVSESSSFTKRGFFSGIFSKVLGGR